MAEILFTKNTGAFLPGIRNGGKGFSLLELVLVVAIIFIVSSVVLTSVHTSRKRTKVAVAKSEIAQ